MKTIMHKIKWDDKFFERSGIYLWIYNQGFLVRTNENYRSPAFLKTLEYLNIRNTELQKIKNNKIKK